MNNVYLEICYYNLYEKYLCGGIEKKIGIIYIGKNGMN